MRGKKAKLLRRHAREITQGQPYAVYLRHNTTKTIILKPDCTKGTYRKLKALIKQGVAPWTPTAA